MKTLQRRDAAAVDALGEARSDPHGAAAAPGAAVALTLALAQPGLAPSDRVAARLRGRLQAQRQAQAALQTLQSPRSRPAQTAEGRRWWMLGERSRLVELAAGAALRLEPGTHELLLLDGRLVADGQPVALHDYLIGQGAVQAREPSRFYLRHHAPQDPFQCAEGWQRVRPGESAWQPLREGVDICPLHQQSGAVSMLARFAAGGRVPAHAHGIDEQCLMVEGELFLGDLLLREGGFQHAPPGSAHGELMADRPCLLFFHGAIDPVAVDEAWRAEQSFAPM